MNCDGLIRAFRFTRPEREFEVYLLSRCTSNYMKRGRARWVVGFAHGASVHTPSDVLLCLIQFTWHCSKG